MSYRAGHHSTSDDSSRYRTAAEMSAWRARDPVARFQRHLAQRGWWDDDRERALRVAARKEVRAAEGRGAAQDTLCWRTGELAMQRESPAY